jgi:formylglycine-generating enzyme required for sulfatase activity
MGSPSDEEQRGSDEQLHSVTLSSFRMSRHEITNAQFVTFMNENNIGNEQSYLLGSPSAVYYACTKWAYIPGKENYPVVGVSWLGAMEFASFVGGRLPTESEWEYACRGNTNTPFNTGNCLDYSQANYRWDFSYSGCSNENTNYIFDGMPVNSYSPNSYGLYNMHGNAGEWCSDWYGPYSLDSQVNPIGPQSGNQKVLRGGGFGAGAQYCRSASRNPLPTTGLIATDAGFRVVFNP